MEHETWDEAIHAIVHQLYQPPLWEDADTYRGLFYMEDYHGLAYRAFQELPVSVGPQQVVDLLIGKQRDYGPKNIMDGPVDPDTGIRVRLFDKIARYENLTHTKIEPANESLVDTLMDMVGYVAIKIMAANNYMNLPLKVKETEAHNG